MIRQLAIGLACLSLTACGKHYEPIKSAPAPADVPDAALVAPCDTTETDPAVNVALALELAHTRKQRNDCAAQVAGIAQWRKDALLRASTK